MIRNVLAGVTTSLAMVPEVVAFALLAQVNPLVGLYAAFIVGIVSAAFGGRPGLISGGAGSLAVVSVALVISHGVECLFACVVLMGLLQMTFAALKMGKMIKLVSPPVMQGFVNGLAIVIFMAQLKNLPAGGAELYVMVALVVATIVGVLWSPIKSIPASLFGLIPVTLLVAFGGVETKTVGDIAHIAGSLPSFHIPEVPLTMETFWIVLPYSVLLAGIGLLETLLTADMVGETHHNKESMAQGVGNLLTGFFGGMGGCAMIGQTVINQKSGGTTRVSGIVQALCILLYIVVASSIIESIPIAALIGVMIVVCFHTFDWKSLQTLTTTPKSGIIMVVVTVATVYFNLAIAVVIGVMVSALVHYWEHVNETEVG